MPGTRKVIDCRQFPAEKPCTIAISGGEDEVLDLAVLHATSVHGHEKPDAAHILPTITSDPKAQKARSYRFYNNDTQNPRLKSPYF